MPWQANLYSYKEAVLDLWLHQTIDMCAPCEEIKPYGTVGGLNEIIGINVTHSPGSWQLKLVLFSRSDLLDSVSALVRNEVCT